MDGTDASNGFKSISNRFNGALSFCEEKKRHKRREGGTIEGRV